MMNPATVKDGIRVGFRLEFKSPVDAIIFPSLAPSCSLRSLSRSVQSLLKP